MIIMRKKDGFALIETLIVSTIIAAILVYIFVQFNHVNKSYDDNFKYNDVDDLYKLDDIKGYINSLDATSIATITTKIDTDGIIVMNKENDTYSDISYLDNQGDLLDNLGIKTFVLTKADINNVDTSSLSQNLKDMIKKIDNKSDNYRLMAEFDNGACATITVSLEGDTSGE